jgi:uncharacterized membrane protein YcaP (DUF421 family)
MDAVLRATAIYFFLLLLFRIAGQRTLAQLTAFDFVLLLVIAEATQQALLGNDYSMTNAFLVILTLMTLDILFSLLKQRMPKLEKWVDSVPVVLVEHGHPLQDRLQRTRVDEKDILTSARLQHGLERMDQIKYAVLERSGGISIIPNERP